MCTAGISCRSAFVWSGIPSISCPVSRQLELLVTRVVFGQGGRGHDA